MLINQWIKLSLIASLITRFSNALFVNDDEIAIVEDEVEETITEQVIQNAHTECCSNENASFINAHYLLISTMDGKVTALDVEHGGEVVWSVDADQVPLMSSSLSSQTVIWNGFSYMLVPSLDGSLYLFNVENSALSPILPSSDIRIIIGDYEIAGGTFVTSTGVDPLTGKIRYRCTAGKCVQFDFTEANESLFTLIMRKNTQTARAADPLTGTERWNLSVGEYDLTIVSSMQSLRHEKPKAPTHVRFLLQPPNGIITAVDSCGGKKWEMMLSSPIAKAWQLSKGQIFEVSLFSSDTVKALGNMDESGDSYILQYEAPFYFGTVNSEPYIVPSEQLRNELRSVALSNRGRLHSLNAGQLFSDYSYLRDMKVGDLIRNQYLSSKKTTELANSKQSITNYAIENPMSFRSCDVKDALTIAGSKQLENFEDIDGDRGWYIFKPVPKACRQRSRFWSSILRRNGNSNFENCKKNVLEELKQMAYEPVPGWKIVAMFLTLIASSLATVVFLYSKQIRRWGLHKSQNFSNRNLSSNNGSKTHEKVGVRTRVGLRTMSTTASQAGTDNFVSKFLEDFIPEKWLGRGGYGIVFDCRNRLDDRSYAVKRIAVSNTTSAIERVTREARAMAKLDHPGIIRYFHTWMEKPPTGWQQAKDKEILKHMRNASNYQSSNSDIKSIMSESRTDLSKPINDANLSSCTKGIECSHESISHHQLGSDVIFKNGHERTFASGDVKEDTDCLSWADDDKSPNSVDDDSSSDDISNENVDQITALVEENGESSSSGVIFLNGDSHENASEHASSESSSSPDPFEPPAVLVTCLTDLQSYKQKKNYVYLYIQMELCQELTLHNWLLANNREKDRDAKLMRKWFAQLVCAINYIHSKGLIHRDLKPQNIFFSTDNFLKIGDLGLATNYLNTKKCAEWDGEIIKSVSHTGNVGTRLYMSPEQLNGKPYNEKIDIFSLGLIFVELITPFKTVMERSNILTGLQKGKVPAYLDGLPNEKKVVTWLTMLDPDKRPSAQEILECDFVHEDISALGLSYTRERSASTDR